MRVEIVPAEVSHVQAMAGRYRPADIRELQDSAQVTPEEAIRIGIEVSDESWTGLIDGIPVCCFGVARLHGLVDTGAPWMVGTNEIETFAPAFIRGCRPVVKGFLNRYSTLLNFVDVRNEKAIRWAKWLGFRFFDPAPYGVKNLPFRMFEMRRA